MNEEIKRKFGEVTDRALFWCTLAMLFIPLVFVPSRNIFNDFFYYPKFCVLMVLSVIALLLALAKLLLRYERASMSLQDGLALAFFALCAVAASLSRAPLRSIYGVYYRYGGMLTQMGYAACFFAASLSLSTERRRRTFFLVLTLVTVVASIYGIVQYLGLDPAPRDFQRQDPWWKYQSFSTLANPHYFADFLLLSLPVFALLILSGSKRYILVFSLALFTLISCLCRGGYFAAALCTLIAIPLVVRLRLFDIKRAVLVALLSLSLLAVVEGYGHIRNYCSTPLIRTGFVRDREGRRRVSFVGGRPLVWSVAVEAILERPFLGWGQENFRMQDRKIKERIAGGGGRLPSSIFDRAENEYLQVAYDCGVPAALLYILLLGFSVGVLFGAAFRHKNRADILEESGIFWTAVFLGLGVGVLGYATEQFFSFATINQAPVLWLVLGFSSAVSKAVLEKSGGAPSVRRFSLRNGDRRVESPS